MSMRFRFIVLSAVLSLLSALAWSDAGKPVTNKQEEPCHILMTQQECTQFHATLAKLPAGPRRDQMLEWNAQLMKEREGACACNHVREAVYLSDFPAPRTAF
jgi:hypothetical protein